LKIAIVGSRTFPNLRLVESIVSELPENITVISGGAAGVDTTAIETAQRCGMTTEVILPELEGCKQQHEFTRAYHRRNQKIVDAADAILAFTEKSTGGTFDTIERAKRAGLPLKLIKHEKTTPDANLLDTPSTRGELETSTSRAAAQTEARPGIKQSGKTEPRAANRPKGVGPFQVKRISLGSYALRLRRYMPAVEWTEFMRLKAEEPAKAAELMLPDFIEFFKAHPVGHCDLITMPPRSIRHLDRAHPMTFVCQTVAEHLSCEFREVFLPWNKPSRGRHAAVPDGEVVGVDAHPGRVVYVLDDISTSNRTLQAAVSTLMGRGIHGHGIAWMLWA